MDESKIARLLELSSEIKVLKRIIHGCHLEYDDAGAEEYERKVEEIHAVGRELYATMTREEIVEFERRMKERRYRQ